VAALALLLMSGFLKRHNQRLRDHNELLLNAAGEGIYGLDAHGKISFINPAAAKVVGWAPEELIGRSPYAMKGDDQRALEAGCVGYIAKPINTRTLPDLLASYLNRQREANQ
jgi:PAS domain-containing protein